MNSSLHQVLKSQENIMTIKFDLLQRTGLEGLKSTLTWADSPNS